MVPAELTAYAQILHGLYFSHGQVRVIEAGVQDPTGYAFVSTDVFGITLSAGVVTYTQNDVEIGTSIAALTAPAMIGAALYLSGDQIFNATIGTIVPATASSAGTGDLRFDPAVSNATLTGMGGAVVYARLNGHIDASVKMAGKGGVTVSATRTAKAHATLAGSGGVSANPHFAYSRASFLPLGTYAYEGSYSSSSNSMQPLTSLGTGGLLTPDVAYADNSMCPITGYGHGLVDTTGSSSEFALMYPMLGLASDHRYGASSNYLYPLIGIGFKLPVISWVNARLPALGARAVITSQPLTGTTASLPALTGAVFGGAYVNAALPSLIATVTGTVQSTMRADATLPALSGLASGVVGGISNAAGTLPALTAEAFGGGQALGTLPSLEASGSGIVGGIAEAAAVLPALTGIAAVTTEALMRADVVLPALSAAPSGQAWITLPALTAHALGGDVVAVTYEAYAINLTTGAVSHYTNYPFDNILRFGGSYYGVKSDGVFLIGGNLDLTVPISAHIKTFQTDFGVKNYKRLPYIYASGRSDGGVTIGVTPDEGVTYEYDSYWGEVPGNTNHRTTIGKGIKGVYYSLDVKNINGGSFELDEISVQVTPTVRAV
jgi:hypothetical protein